MRRVLALSIDQLFRPSPGGIATYVRGLVVGLADLQDPSLDVVGLAPRGRVPDAVAELALRRVTVGLPLVALTRVWSAWPLGVPRGADVVHATTVAGPFSGGAPGARHSVALHDLLWRDEPGAATARGARFHESRLRLLARREEVRVFTTSPLLEDRLVAEGFARSRLVRVRLGVDLDVEVAPPARVREVLAPRGITGPYTLYAGTREPRKNLATLVAAHHGARAARPELGPLVLAGPAGWGADVTGDATVLGVVERAVLRGLYRDAAVVAYVPRAEGWGLPPVEALAEGARVVASATTPSVAANLQVVVVDPGDVDAVAAGLVAAIDRPDDGVARAARRASVAELTWRRCALDHLAGWR
ncbi:MAG: glycosyltransferase [Acidimicrobiales bacterium]